MSKKIFLLLSFLILSFGGFLFSMKKSEVLKRIVYEYSDLFQACNKNQHKIVETIVDSKDFDDTELNSLYNLNIHSRDICAYALLSFCLEWLNRSNKNEHGKDELLSIKKLLSKGNIDVNCVRVLYIIDKYDFSFYSLIDESYGVLCPEFLNVAVVNCPDHVANQYKELDMRYLKNVLELSVCNMTGNDELYKACCNDFCTDDEICFSSKDKDLYGGDRSLRKKKQEVFMLKKLYLTEVRGVQWVKDNSPDRLGKEPFSGFLKYIHRKSISTEDKIKKDRIIKKLEESIIKLKALIREKDNKVIQWKEDTKERVLFLICYLSDLCGDSGTNTKIIFDDDVESRNNKVVIVPSKVFLI